MDKRTIRAWCLYDFGNSAFAVLFPAVYAVYFGEIVGDPERADFLWGLVVSLSMFMVAFTSPFLGGVADHAGLRKRMLGVYTGLAIAAVLLVPTLAEGMVVSAFLIGLVANFAFEGGIVFYNSFLPDIAPREYHGRVSARGFAVGYVGSLIALGYTAVLAGLDLVVLIWLFLGLHWALAATPAFRRLPPDRPTGLGFFGGARQGLAQTAATFRRVWALKSLRWFLIAYFFYIDGVNTVIVFASRYATTTLEFETGELMAMLALVQIAALAGSLATAKPTDIRGPHWTVRLTLFWWIAVVITAYFATSKAAFFVTAGFAGLGLGSIQAASRAFMSRLIPKGSEAEMFGFYALCGKTGAILGPLVFGIISAAFGSQRPAVLAVSLFYVAGLLLLRNVKLASD
ncbi:MAG: MFS transporter [Planctomycetota bacterium]|jgi:UMF1 family MFS transporter